MKRLFYSLALLLCALSSQAQFGTITFNQDTVVIVRRLKIMTLRPGSVGDSIIVHKANGNIGALHMNQFTIPWVNITSQPTIPTNNNQLTNGMNFITGITSTMVDNALGYTAYDGASNPLGFLNSVPAQSWTSITGKPTFAAVATSGDYNNLINKPTITTYTSGSGINIISNAITNTAPDQTVSLTGAGGLVASGTYPNFTLTQYVPTDNSVTRTINSSTYTISSTKAVTVRYNIKISCTATIGSASTGKVLFQYSTNGGSSWIDAGEVENSNTVTLAVVLNSTTTQSGFIVWNVPANALCRLVPTSSGTTTITWIRGQETY